jgi:hypothetical protein
MSADCGTRTYTGMTKGKVQYIRDQLAGEGATTTGNNPWEVDTHKGESLVTSSVKLHAEWNEATSVLSLSITDRPGVASCDKVWSAIEPLVQQVQAMKDPAADPNYEAKRAMGQIDASTAVLALAPEQLQAFKQTFSDMASPAAVATTTPAPAGTPEASAASAAAAVTAAPKTAYYVLGGAALLGIGWMIYRGRRG